MDRTKQTALLMRELRTGTESGQLGLLSVECFLHIAEQPRTIEQLVQLTQARNAHVNRAVLKLTPWYDRQAGVVRLPELHLLQRRRRPQARGYRVHLTCKGRELLARVGFQESL